MVLKKVCGVVACYVLEDKDIIYMPLHRNDSIKHFLGGIVIKDNTHEMKYEERFVVGFLKTDKMIPPGKLEEGETKEWVLKMDEIKKKLNQCSF